MSDAKLQPPTLADAMRLQLVEGNPLTAAEARMFEMFEREGWNPERQRSYILSLALAPAAE